MTASKVACPNCHHSPNSISIWYDETGETPWWTCVEEDCECGLSPEEVARALIEDAEMEIRPGCPHHDLTGDYPPGAEAMEPCTCPVPWQRFEEMSERAVSLAKDLIEVQRELLEVTQRMRTVTEAEVTAAYDSFELNWGPVPTLYVRRALQAARDERIKKR